MSGHEWEWRRGSRGYEVDRGMLEVFEQRPLRSTSFYRSTVGGQLCIDERRVHHLVECDLWCVDSCEKSCRWLLDRGEGMKGSMEWHGTRAWTAKDWSPTYTRTHFLRKSYISTDSQQSLAACQIIQAVYSQSGAKSALIAGQYIDWIQMSWPDWRPLIRQSRRR